MKKNKTSAIKKIITKFTLSFAGLFLLQIVLFSSPVEAKSPVITLLGQQFVAVNKGTTYVDAGATANDEEDGDLTDEIETFNSVNTNVSGYYIVAYSVVDSDGNKNENIGRMVVVMDKTLPIIFTDNVAPSMPVAKPAAGYYDDDQKVYLSSSDKETGLDKIYYTTDGTIPNKTSQVYSSVIEVDRDMTIKAIAYDKADNKSGMLQAKYEIDKGSDDDDDDDDSDKNDNSPEQKVINISVPANSSTNKNGGGDNNGSESNVEEKTTSQVQGEQVNTAQAQSMEDDLEDSGAGILKGGLIWWIIGFLAVILVLGIILWMRRRKKDD
jgi:hypothetical protein